MAETKFRKRGKQENYQYFYLLPLLLLVLTYSFIAGNRFMNGVLPVVATFKGVPTGYLPHELPLSAQDLRVLPDTGYFGAVLARSEERLSGYRQDLQNLPKMSAGAAVDVILQAHTFPGMTVEMENHVRKKQGAIFRQLQHGQYDLVVIEGQSLDRLTPQAIKQQVMRITREMKAPLSSVEYDLFFQQELPLDAGLRYMVEYPNRTVAGGEDPDLNMLHDTLLNGGFEGIAASDTLSEKLRIMRSIIPLTRTLKLLHQAHGRRAAIIIGSAHGPELQALMQSAGIRGRLLDAWR